MGADYGSSDLFISRSRECVFTATDLKPPHDKAMASTMVHMKPSYYSYAFISICHTIL